MIFLLFCCSFAVSRARLLAKPTMFAIPLLLIAAVLANPAAAVWSVSSQVGGSVVLPSGHTSYTVDACTNLAEIDMDSADSGSMIVIKDTTVAATGDGIFAATLTSVTLTVTNVVGTSSTGAVLYVAASTATIVTVTDCDFTASEWGVKFTSFDGATVTST